MKPRKCKACKHPFMPARSTQVACGIDCAMQLAHERKVKLAECDRLNTVRKDRARKEKLKSLSQLAKEAEREVNRYVRARDFKEGCISCDKPPTWQGQWHASHFRSVGSAKQLRFNLWNINKSCSVCNNWKSGNIGEYAPRLLQKIGPEKYQFLVAQKGCRKYNREYLERLKRVFSRKARRQEIRNAKFDC